MLDMDVINAAMVRSRTDPEAYAAGQASNAKNKQKTELNQQDFLTLMVTQLKNQDPFKPMDPSQHVGQLASHHAQLQPASDVSGDGDGGRHHAFSAVSWTRQSSAACHRGGRAARRSP